MYVLYENDNLLERFRLHVQNGTIGTTETVVENGDADDQEGGTVELNTLQMSRRLHCGPSNGFVLLVAKWSKQTLETIADTVRLIMSQVTNTARRRGPRITYATYTYQEAFISEPRRETLRRQELLRSFRPSPTSGARELGEGAVGSRLRET